jgi:signal transduction histidine kinase
MWALIPSVMPMLTRVTDTDAGGDDARGRLTFPDVPQLALDQLLVQLIARAGDVASAQGRLRGLLRANRMIAGNLELPVVLRQIIEAACDLVGARYGALGVIGPDGGLEQFIHVGMPSDLVTRIGHLPEGKGVLGALIEDPRPIRLTHISDHPRSVGFPEGHPPMSSFLGVPITVRNVVFGNLYLAEGKDDRFSAEDEELVLSLAASAAVAIENAHLYSTARQREEGLRASTEMTQQLLANTGDDPLQAIAERAWRMSDADMVSLILPVDEHRLMVEVAVGDGADQLTTATFDRDGTLAGQAIDTRRPVMTNDLAKSGGWLGDAMIGLADGPVGAAMAIPLSGSSGPRGALVITRHAGRPAFDDIALDVATTFAGHAAVALELSDARADQQKMLLLEDRDRIARDLHDHVIQRLFAAGLSVQSVAGSIRDDPTRERLSRVVNDVDDTIRQIRTTIFELRGSIVPGGTIRTRLLDVVGETRPVLGFDPHVRFSGPVDSAVPEALVDDITAVLREALTNVARHARATTVSVDITATVSRLDVVVEDDGIGIARGPMRSGLANLERRALAHSGSLEVSPAPGCGTQVRWSVPFA